MNKVFLIGNLTKNPVLNTTASGINVCKFTLAVTRKFKNSDGSYDCDFINIVTWRQLADNCAKYLSKGKKCSVVGRMEIRQYDDANGEKKHITEIIADEVEFLSPKQEDEQCDNGDITKLPLVPQQKSMFSTDDELPF